MYGVSLRPSLVLRPELRQTLTPQQRQLVDVLELPDVAVAGYLDEVLSSNPALSRTPDARAGREVSRAFARRAGEDDLPPIEDRHTETPDLMEHLFAQFRLERTTDAEKAAGVMILGNLDEHGILAESLDDIAFAVGVDVADAESAQMVVMELEPIGCGANDIIHYLSFMVKRQWPDDPFFPELIEDHLDELKRGRFDAIGRAMDMDVEDVEEYQRMLVEEVDPWPARGFTGSTADFVRPCMDVLPDEEKGPGVFKVEMHEPPKPPVRLDPRYEAKVHAMDDGPEKKEALEKLEQARWVVRSLEERHSLVKQVAEIAVERQSGFFHRGEIAIQNLTMAEVAEALNRDTSTVSRAVMGRYYEFDGRTLPLRDLFVNRGGGQDTSEAALHAAIQQVVDDEDKRRPLSDEKIAKLLKARGMTGVARRTVAKHRERVGIPSSRDRKQR